MNQVSFVVMRLFWNIVWGHKCHGTVHFEMGSFMFNELKLN